MSGSAAVVFDRVSKRYGGVTAVDEVSFEIEAGTLVTLLGPSGCGKTTTLRLIAGLEHASAGRILIDGADVTARSPAERDVSMVFQSYALFPHLSVLDNVCYGLRSSGVPKRQAADQARAKLDLVGLAGLEDRLPSELSGGQQQRVALARAMVLEPKVLLFDEPLSNLDARLRRRVRDEIRLLQQSLGLTAVYVTHDQSEALAISDRIIVMNSARIAQDGTPRALYEAPADRFVVNFMGEASILAVEVAALDGDTAIVRMGEATLSMPRRGLGLGAAELAIRPHAVRLSCDTDAAGAPRGFIRRAVYGGDHMEYDVTVNGFSEAVFAVDTNVSAPFAVGDEVGVTFSPTGLALLPTAERDPRR
jgi:iron(III) transport system ATP-binding protein